MIADPAPADEALPARAAAQHVAATIVGHFVLYNTEFGRVTCRAARNFLTHDVRAAQRDAIERIELYEQWVARCVIAVDLELKSRRNDLALWSEIKREYERQITRRPDMDFYSTFFNSVTRDLFGTVGVNEGVEFCSTRGGRASGAVPIRVYRVAGSMADTVREILTDLPFGEVIQDPAAAIHRISADIGRNFAAGRRGGSPESIELIEPVFYRGMEAFVVGRLIGDGTITPLVLAFGNSGGGVGIKSVISSYADVSSLFGYARSYFHVDLPVVSAAITLLRTFMPRKPVDELYTVLGRAKQGKTERYFSLQRHLTSSIDSFVHAPGERGLVMIVFTLPSHDLVFKVIRDHFGAPKTTSRADVVERYGFVFRHDRAGRLVDAQEFKRLRLPLARFMPILLDELLHEGGESCRIEGDDLIIEHCYIERRLRPLNLYLREADPAAAENAIIDYGNALRDLAASNVFPGDLLLKNFGVTNHGRVIFYDYDELCLLTDCVFRDLPQPRNEEEEASGEPWFHYGPHDVFPEQWLPFLAIPSALCAVFTQRHGDLLTAGWWRGQRRIQAAAVGITSLMASQPASQNVS